MSNSFIQPVDFNSRSAESSDLRKVFSPNVAGNKKHLWNFNRACFTLIRLTSGLYLNTDRLNDHFTFFCRCRGDHSSTGRVRLQGLMLFNCWDNKQYIIELCWRKRPQTLMPPYLAVRSYDLCKTLCIKQNHFETIGPKRLKNEVWSVFEVKQ